MLVKKWDRSSYWFKLFAITIWLKSLKVCIFTAIRTTKGNEVGILNYSPKTKIRSSMDIFWAGPPPQVSRIYLKFRAAGWRVAAMRFLLSEYRAKYGQIGVLGLVGPYIQRAEVEDGTVVFGGGSSRLRLGLTREFTCSTCVSVT